MVAVILNRYRAKVTPSQTVFDIRDVAEKIMTYVDEDDRFRMRKLNRMFQSFFYKQTVVYNYGRALLLAKMGRSFPRVTELKIDLDNLSGSTLKYITPETFSRLVRISLTSTAQRVTLDDLTSLKHPGIRELKVDLNQPADIAAITEARFPELRTLSIAIKGFICVKPYRPLSLSPHPKLKEIKMDHLFLDDSFFETLTAENFPELHVLKICEDSCFLIELSDEELREMIQGHGIQLEFLANANIGGIISLDREITKLL